MNISTIWNVTQYIIYKYNDSNENNNFLFEIKFSIYYLFDAHINSND